MALTPIEAFDHFLNWFQGNNTRLPNDVQQAKYAREGRTKYPLGNKRIRNLLGKYAPGRYRFTEVVEVVGD